MFHSRDEHSIENEPHLRYGSFEADPSEAKVDQKRKRPAQSEIDHEQVEHSVWSEPTLSPEFGNSPDADQWTYGRWLQAGMERTTWLDSMLITLGVALAAGPWGVLGAFASAGATGFGILMVTVFGPVAEEVAKVAAALWVVEKRPYWFKSSGQILFCALCGGLAFAALENLVYMYIYVPNHTWDFVVYRWTVCVLLHVSCSLIAGVGLARMWRDSIGNRRPPQMSRALPWLFVAMGIHGLYNLSVTVASSFGWLDFGMHS